MDSTTLSQQSARCAATMVQLVTAIKQYHVIMGTLSENRTKTPFLQRLDWDTFVQNYKDRPFFRRHMRMSYKSFCRLVNLLIDKLQFDEEMGSIRGGNIIPEIHVYATIRYLAGALYTDICCFCGISVTSFYTIVRRTINAINECINISFPSSAEECALAAAGFEEVSHDGVIKNCIGAVDGFLLSIRVPPKKLAHNVRGFFSGHYQKYGINIQASCDVNCRFTFVGLGGPGVTADRVGVHTSGLYEKIEAIPQGYIVIGDCAYQPTEKLVPIFGGNLALKADNDNFNFFASQLRIRIEMSFGIMTRKWGILQRPLLNDLRYVKKIICCIARLHNYCIDERMNSMVVDPIPASPGPRRMFTPQISEKVLTDSQLAYAQAAAEAENLQILSLEYPQWSLTRDLLVKTIKDRGLVRPKANQLRKRQQSLQTCAPAHRSFQAAELAE